MDNFWRLCIVLWYHIVMSMCFCEGCVRIPNNPRKHQLTTYLFYFEYKIGTIWHKLCNKIMWSKYVYTLFLKAQDSSDKLAIICLHPVSLLGTVTECHFSYVSNVWQRMVGKCFYIHQSLMSPLDSDLFLKPNEFLNGNYISSVEDNQVLDH